jgi:hypothetical protein
VAADYFWPEYTGTWDHSDGVYVSVSGVSQDLANWDESNWYDDSELNPPGTMDVDAAASEDDQFYWIEIEKDLDSGDVNDWALTPGQEIGYSPSDSYLFALITDASFYSRNLRMQLGAGTLQPQPTATRRTTSTPTSPPSEEPAAVGTVKSNANLRSGPGVAYAVIVSLPKGTAITVLESNQDSTWFRVEVVSSGKTGWLSAQLVTYAFDVDSIPVARVIPPTPTYAPVEPTQPPVLLNFDTHIAVTNKLEVAITVYLTGPYKTSFTVQSGQTIQVDVPSGTYSFSAYAYGYNTLTGSKTWNAGEYDWEFYAT